MTKIFKTVFDNWLVARRFVVIILVLTIIMLTWYDNLTWLILYKPFNLITFKGIITLILALIAIDYHFQGV